MNGSLLAYLRIALALTSVLLWLASLTQPALIAYNNQRAFGGAVLAMIAWLGPLYGGYYAWFANPLLGMAAVNLLLRQKRALLYVLPAAVLSLDTFRVTSIPLDEGGGRSALYGYGWGAIIWFAAICSMLMAAGIREFEESRRGSKWALIAGGATTVVAISAFAVLIGGTYRLGTQQRMQANAAERKRLSSIAFKRGPVCSKEVVPSMHTFRLSGPLELVREPTAALPIDERTLINWGVPVVRSGRRDYSLRLVGAERLLTSVPSFGPSAVRLVAQYESVADDGTRLRAILLSGDGKQVGFDQILEPDGDRYCPDRGWQPDGEGGLIAAIEDALATADGQPLQPPRSDDEAARKQFLVYEVTEVPTDRRQLESGSSDCSLDPVSTGPEQPGFRIEERRIDGAAWIYGRTCDADALYIGRGWTHKGSSYEITKRSRKDLALIWNGELHLESREIARKIGATRVLSVEESAEHLTVRLVGRDNTLWELQARAAAQ